MQAARSTAELAPVLLRDALHVAPPACTRAAIVSATLTDIQPVEYRADLVVLVRDDAPAPGTVVEAQLRKDPDKTFSWPTSATLLRSRHRRPVCILVFAGDESVAEWARQPIHIGGGNRLGPILSSPCSRRWRMALTPTPTRP